MKIEVFDFFQMQTIGSGQNAFVVELIEMQELVPKEFLALYEYLDLNSEANSTVEIEYKVCSYGACAIRYNLWSESKGYQKALVFSATNDSQITQSQAIDVKSLAAMFSLTEILNVLDINRVNQNPELIELLRGCYRQNMYNRADVSCLIEKLKNTSESSQRVFLDFLR